MSEFDLAEAENEQGIRTLNVPEYPPIHERVWNTIKMLSGKTVDAAIDLKNNTATLIRDTVQGVALWARNLSCEQVDCKKIYKYAGYSEVANALDHAIVSTVVARNIHPNVALVLGEMKEILGPLGNRYDGTDEANKRDSEIDRCNNKIGAQIGEFARMHNLSAADTTSLISDALKYKQFSLGDNKALQRWNNAECRPWDGPSLEWVRNGYLAQDTTTATVKANEKPRGK